jgi:hypothetical protein
MRPFFSSFTTISAFDGTAAAAGVERGGVSGVNIVSERWGLSALARRVGQGLQNSGEADHRR